MKFQLIKKCMKASVICFILICSALTAFSQNVTKFRATAFSFTTRSEETEIWNDWEEWKDANILLVYDSKKQRMVIYSAETQEYDINKIYMKKHFSRILFFP